ncbi:TetR/AcrR family transcriptional regulator [Novosphingobium taihuense]|uniref:AcrR family transcriptional regulator n=1 Tax=Novosphingobium taihuense TaxID=260085 RepID=A0A7W7ETN1_9SPHN|nr:TetR/AcrR family transcriptional regulator [Novosphingobium taihuense]MBB4613412.1 AcrR family transcriptional regulator [Novosphingobium taihuense]TWH80918.1 TetR family transcriptional regulator [Novosphingobium taihuense]
MRVTTVTRERRGKPSHRNDLRSELLDAACDFVVREGHEGLSIRKLAEDVGVSPGAPYHHFPDRRALLIAVALEGYRLLFAETEKAVAQSPQGVLFSNLLHFIRFAAANPNMFTLMYESELVRPQIAPELAEAQDVGFQMLRREVARATQHLSEHERSLRIATIWSAIFGFALQTNRAMLRAHPLEPMPDELAPEIVRQALRLMA